MRTADTYRANRRNECRQKCRAYGLKLSDKWPELTAGTRAAARTYWPKSTSKYMPHQGAREKARRLRRMASEPTAIPAE